MKIHFIGIGGIGVSALAKYYLEKGHEVSGSDLVSSEITDDLRKKGAKIFTPYQNKFGTGQVGKHKVKNLSKNIDLVIYSPAVPKDNPELKKAFRLQNSNFKLRVLSYPEALGELTKKYFTIAVCGSHGKSTVTAMIGILLTKAGFDPTVIVGTKVKEFGDSNFRMGGQKSKVKSQKSILVIEADEHFASFLNYWPKIIVLTALEADHLDYYKNFKNYLLAFKKFISHLPKDGVLIANKDDKIIQKLLKPNKTAFSTIVANAVGFSLKQWEAKKIKKILKVPGEFNVSNALAALMTARALKIPDKISFEALSEYKGSWRRFEIHKVDLKRTIVRIRKLKRKQGIILISDYGHHPTQVRETLKTAREKFQNRKIWCVFQPHQYQRTYYLWNDFVKVLREAPVDKLILTDIYEVAGREDKAIKKKVSSKKLVEAIDKPFVIYLPKQKILNFLKKNLEGSRPKRGEPRSKGTATSKEASLAPKGRGEVVIVMGAGDIYKLCEQLTKSK